jgi:sugar phosphate isomerase/epimerase
LLIGLSALSFSYQCGLIGRDTTRVVSRALTIEELISLAARAGLQSIELPFALLHDLAPERLARLRDLLVESRLTPVLDTDVADLANLEQAIPAAAAIGATALRVLASPVLEGNRGAFAQDWSGYLESVIARLRAVRPLAEEKGVTIAVENHQDLTTSDLLSILHEVGGPCVGVAFDPVNAYVVAEDPFAALPQLAPHIRTIHLSDFLAYPTREGWRLVRCALGEGDFNLRRFLALAEERAPEAACQIELVAHSSRHVRLLTDAWWRGYPPRDVRDVIGVLREFAAASRSQDDDWRTPWERGAAEPQIRLYEEQQFASSLSYLRAIGMLPKL